MPTPLFTSLILVGFLATWSVSCWRGGAARQKKGDQEVEVPRKQAGQQVVIPTPYDGQILSIGCDIGEQVELSWKNVCWSTVVRDTDWEPTLRALYAVEIGSRIDTQQGPVYGIRFHYKQVYGDIVSETNHVRSDHDIRCRDYIIRVQVTTDRPSRWRTTFAVSGLWPPSVGPYFTPDPEYPPGYP
jgi:hypothetical protein